MGWHSLILLLQQGMKKWAQKKFLVFFFSFFLLKGFTTHPFRCWWEGELEMQLRMLFWFLWGVSTDYWDAAIFLCIFDNTDKVQDFFRCLLHSADSGFVELSPSHTSGIWKTSADPFWAPSLEYSCVTNATLANKMTEQGCMCLRDISTVLSCLGDPPTVFSCLQIVFYSLHI